MTDSSDIRNGFASLSPSGQHPLRGAGCLAVLGSSFDIPPGSEHAETYRPIAEIVAELKVIETQARETDRALKDILEKIGI